MTPYNLAALDTLLVAGREVNAQTNFIDTSTGKIHALFLHQFPNGELRLLVMVADETMLPLQFQWKERLQTWLLDNRHYHHLAHGQFWKGASA